MITLIERFLTLKSRYRNYDTAHAIRRMQAFRRSVRDLSAKGYPVAVELLGSISFGIAEPCSDADCVLLHFCDLHLENGECPPSCPNLIFEQSELLKGLKKYLKEKDMFHVDFMDWINLRYVDRIIAEGQAADNEIAFRLLYYRTLGRPVNRPLFIKYCETLERDEAVMKGFSRWSSEALATYVKTSTHRLSFNKYNERMATKRQILPPDMKEELKNYLEQKGDC